MIGTQLGPWVIDKELGRGGMGAVYHAHAGANGEGPKVAAVKVLAAELAADPGFLARFQREIDILRKLDHPNIVRFFESGEQANHYYYAMEYIEGQSYETLLAQQGKQSWSDVLDLAIQVTPALKHAHDRGVIHRDLKPSNLLRTPSGKIKLTDFGIASLFASKHLTVTGGIVGTAEYLSPEQAAGKPVTRRSDLYSLGAVMYTLVTGRTPFEGELLDLLQKHRFGQFDRPSRIVPDIPPDLDAIICDLLAKEPAQRPPDGSVLLRRLESLRRKMDRKAAQVGAAPTSAVQVTGTKAKDQPGPATLMSRLMREELEHQQKGGPVQRFFNRPIVLITLFLITVSLIVWAFVPASSESLFQKGAALMQSENKDDWDRGIDVLDQLDKSDPNHKHQTEVEAFRKQYNELLAQRKADKAAKSVHTPGEAEYFYTKGLRLRQEGQEDKARATWQALVDAFKGVPSEEPWVKLAEDALKPPAAEVPATERHLEAIEAALKEAKRLREDNKPAEADKIERALEKLYGDDPNARKLLDK
jgi:eukaryotic-like serine/threonine-protein kinase